MGFWIDPGGDLARAAADMLAALLVWWLAPESVFTGLDGHAERFGALTAPIVVAVLTVSLLAQIGKTILTRRGEPLVTAAAGLVRYLITVSVGVAVIGLGLGFADAATAHFLGTAMPGFVDRLTKVLQLPGMDVSVQILFGFTVLALGALQWLLMFVRQAGIFVLIAVLPIAASGALTGLTRRWLPTVVAWLAALICYKPFAGLIYAIGMVLMSSPAPAGEGAPPWAPVLVGIVVLALAVIALPALMKFFSFTGVAVSGGGAIGGVLAGTATGAISLAGTRSGTQMELTGPGSAPTWTQTPPGSDPGGGTGTGSGDNSGDSDGHSGTGGPGAEDPGGPGQPPGPSTPAPTPEPTPEPGAASVSSTAAGSGAGAQTAAQTAAGAGAGATGGATVAAAAAASAAQSAAQAATEQMTTPPASGAPSGNSSSGGGESGGGAGRSGPSGAAPTPPGGAADSGGGHDQ